MGNSKKRIFNNLKFNKVPVSLTLTFITLCIFLFVYFSGTNNSDIKLIIVGSVLIWLINIFKIVKVTIDQECDCIEIHEKTLLRRSKSNFPLSNFTGLRIVFSIDKPTDTSTNNFGASPNWGKVQYKSFSLYLVSNNEEIKIRQFTNPTEAKQLQRELSHDLNKQILKPIRLYKKD